MLLVIASDLHGSALYGRKLLDAFVREKAERLLLLGDILYHGPRNDLPDGYAPKELAALLNAQRGRILAVRGNCDADVDQFLIKFPIMADFSEILTENARFFVTHGHLWNAANVPPVQQGTILAHGHTHIPEIRPLPEGVTLFNPGSISLPKRNFPPTFGFFDGENLSVRRLEDGAVLLPN